MKTTIILFVVAALLLTNHRIAGLEQQVKNNKPIDNTPRMEELLAEQRKFTNQVNEYHLARERETIEVIKVIRDGMVATDSRFQPIHNALAAMVAKDNFNDERHQALRQLVELRGKQIERLKVSR